MKKSYFTVLVFDLNCFHSSWSNGFDLKTKLPRSATLQEGHEENLMIKNKFFIFLATSFNFLILRLFVVKLLLTLTSLSFVPSWSNGFDLKAKLPRSAALHE